MLHMIIGGAGCGKSTRLMERVQAQVDAGERVITLVPEQFSYEFDQKLYRILGPKAFNQLETHSFKSLARSVFQRFGCVPDGRKNADELTRMALLYQKKSCVSWADNAARHRFSRNCPPCLHSSAAMGFSRNSCILPVRC